jgi:hypothetical protein
MGARRVPGDLDEGFRGIWSPMELQSACDGLEPALDGAGRRCDDLGRWSRWVGGEFGL